MSNSIIERFASTKTSYVFWGNPPKSNTPHNKRIKLTLKAFDEFHVLSFLLRNLYAVR